MSIEGVVSIVAIAVAIWASWDARQSRRIAEEAYWRECRADLRARAIRDPISDNPSEPTRWDWIVSNVGPAAAIDVELRAEWGTGIEGGWKWLRQAGPDGTATGYTGEDQYWGTFVLRPHETAYFSFAFPVGDDGGHLLMKWKEARGKGFEPKHRTLPVRRQPKENGEGFDYIVPSAKAPAGDTT